MPAPVTTVEISLCERLIAAFALATQQLSAESEARGVWARLLDMHYSQLAKALQDGDATELAHLLASMFQQDITSGMMVHAHAANTRSRVGSRVLALKSLDALVSLGEAIGAIPADGPEQRRGGLVFAGDAAELLDRIEQQLGIGIESPGIGAPFGLDVCGRLVTLETPEQVYAAVRLDQATKAHLSPAVSQALSIVEIGGGYGGMCYWYLRLQPDVARYTIIDLPIVNVLQGYFLSQALGADSISLLGEPRAKLQILPNSGLADVDTPFDVLVNKDSMPEMPRDTMVRYLEWGRLHCSGLFFSYNQEAGIEFLGQTEGRVPEAIEQVGGFHKLRRDQSWLRRGYVEEIYVRTL